jgi:multidrug resistance protein, MATE family
VLAWGFLFGAATTAVLLMLGDPLIDTMTTSAEVRQAAREFTLFAALAPVMGVLAYTFDGIYIGATWARDMRNLMLAALAIYLATWWVLQGYGNTGLWIALLVFLASRGMLQAARYPKLMSVTFKSEKF